MVYLHRINIHFRDLDTFNSLLEQHLASVRERVSKLDLDLQKAIGEAASRANDLAAQAEAVVMMLSATTRRTRMKVLPTLNSAVENSDLKSMSDLLDDADQALATLKQLTRSTRREYLELLKYFNYLTQSIEASLDWVIIQGLEVTESSADDQSFSQSAEDLEFTLEQLKETCSFLENCPDFWLKLHETELTLEKVGHETKQIRKRVGKGLGLASTVPSGCLELLNNLRLFCKKYQM